MSTPKLIYVRASVASTCNLSCRYCPKMEGMENKVPSIYKGQTLSTNEYITNLIHLSRNGVKGVSFTGGEPTLNKDLPVILKKIRPYFEKIELTTNGFKYDDIAKSIYKYIDVIKISLDTSSPESLAQLTNGTHTDYYRAINAINISCSFKMNVGVNVVLTKENHTHIHPIIEMVKKINSKYKSKAYVSLLDFYYTEERRKYWESNFIPIEAVKTELITKYGLPRKEDIFGCSFYWFNANGVKVRLKDSMSATRRAEKCIHCKTYCQEGMFGIKHSIEGWLTTCPSNDEYHGKLLEPNMTKENADKTVQSVMKDIYSSNIHTLSFKEMLNRNDLKLNLK